MLDNLIFSALAPFQALGVGQAGAFSLQNAAWAIGHILGAIGAAALGAATATWVPFVATAFCCLVTLLVISVAVPARPRG